MREIVELKERISELEGQKNADHELMVGLRERLQQMETELSDYKDIAEQTCNVCMAYLHHRNACPLCVAGTVSSLDHFQENVLLKRQIEESTEVGAHSEAAAGE